MKVTGVCFLVFVVGLALAGDGKPCLIKMTTTNILCYDKTYLDEVSLGFVDDGSKLLFSNKGTVLKELPSDATCEGNFFRRKDEGWKKSPYVMRPTNCCEMVKEYDFYSKIAEKYNIPKECPVKEGTYNIENWEYDYTAKCEKMPRGEFKAQFASNHTSGQCIFAYEIIFKIIDKE